jgi:tetratricopeptide (TPR) repeat protein
MFLFVPIAIVMINILDYFAYRRSFQFFMALGMVFLMAAQAHTVYLRNEIMLYQKILWDDNVKKEPNLSRPHSGLGKAYFDEGNYEKGAMENMVALALNRYPNYYQPALNHCALGNYYLLIKKNDDKASFHYQQALQLQPNIPQAYSGLAMVQLKKGFPTQAHVLIQKAIKFKPNDPSLHYNFSRILLKEGRYDEAISQSRKAIKLQNAFYNEPLAVLAEAFRGKGNLNSAIFYWEKYLLNNPANFEGNLALVELYYLKNKKDLLIQTIGIILAMKGKGGIAQAIKEAELKKNAIYCPEEKVIFPIIKEEIKAILTGI